MININTVAILPIRAKDLIGKQDQIKQVGEVDLLSRAIESALSSESVDMLCVSTDSAEIAEKAKGLGAEAPFLRPARIGDGIETGPTILHYTIKELERYLGGQIETIVSLSCHYPFRPTKLIDQVINLYQEKRFDTVFTVKETTGNYWYRNTDGNVDRIFRENYYIPRDDREPLYRELFGLVCVTGRKWVSDKSMIGESIGVVPVHDLTSLIDLRDPVWKQLDEKIDLSFLEQDAM